VTVIANAIGLEERVLDELVNTIGPGPVGTRTNTPICDDATMPCNQNRPGVPHGTGSNVGIPGWKPGLTDVDREFISSIGKVKNLTLQQLVRLRDENLEFQEEAIRKFGPASTSAIWFEKVIAAYDEVIAETKSHLTSAIEELRRDLDDPSAREKDRRKKVSILIEALRQYQSPDSSKDNDPKIAEAMDLIVEVVKRDADEKVADLKRLVNREKTTPGSVSDDDFRQELLVGMGVERQKQMLGIGEAGPSEMMELAVESLNLTSERRITRFVQMIEKGSLSKRQFTKQMQAILGDERQKQLLGIASGNSMGPVLIVVQALLKARDAAVKRLFRKQAIPGSGITESQVNQAIEDYETAKDLARQWGVAIPHGDFSEGVDFKTSGSR